MALKTTVPIDIRRQFEDALGRESESWAVSSSRNRAGDPGETWVVATKTRLLVGDRGFGGPVTIGEVRLSEVKGCELEGGSFGAGRVVIVGKAGALDHVCFSSLERDDFSRLGDRIRSGAAELPVAEAKVMGETRTSRRNKNIEAVPVAALPMALPVDAPSRRKPLPPRPGRVPASGAFDLFLDQPAAFPGSNLTGVLRLHWPKEKPVRGVRLYWTGREQTRITVGSGKHQRTYREDHAWASYRIGFFGAPDPLGFIGSVGDAMSSAKHPVLKAGTWEYPFEFQVPAGAPAEYQGTHATVTWALEALVDIPRAFDLTARYPIRVIPQGPATMPAREGRSDGSVFVRAWLNGGNVGPGATVTGSFRVGNPSGKTIRWVNVRVLRLENAAAKGHTRQAETVESAIRFAGSQVRDMDVPFEIRLPPSFCPWTGRFSRLSYLVEVALDVAWAFDVNVRLGVP
ncbi:MAG: hypothetical protein FD180_1573 [Planctomycetota bacterium]|nr:MAG: hypothetical protein FD180_1573 [Planctomycetota bacterium]